MRHVETRVIEGEPSGMGVLFKAANMEGQRDKALAISVRLEALAIYVSEKQLPPAEVARLLLTEARKYEAQSMARGVC